MTPSEKIQKAISLLEEARKEIPDRSKPFDQVDEADWEIGRSVYHAKKAKTHADRVENEGKEEERRQQMMRDLL